MCSNRRMEAWRITSALAAFLFSFLLSIAVCSDGVTCWWFGLFYGQTLQCMCWFSLQCSRSKISRKLLHDLITTLFDGAAESKPCINCHQSCPANNLSHHAYAIALPFCQCCAGCLHAGAHLAGDDAHTGH